MATKGSARVVRSEKKAVVIRRPQSERRAATQRELVDATIRSFLDVGFSATTVASIAERCSMSRGALFSHYPTLFDLTTAAIVELFAQLRRDIIDRASRLDTPTPSVVVEELWSLYKRPEMSVIQEALAVAAGNSQLSRRLVPVLADHESATLLAARTWFPTVATHPQFESICRMLICFMQGAALLRGIDADGQREVELVGMAKELAEFVGGLKGDVPPEDAKGTRPRAVLKQPRR